MEVISWVILGIGGLLGALWLLTKVPQERENYVLKNNISTNYFINKNSVMRGKY